jgi:hypothetical protein
MKNYILLYAEPNRRMKKEELKKEKSDFEKKKE